MLGKRYSLKKVLLVATIVTLALLFSGAALAADASDSKPDFGILSLLPPVVAIALAIITRQTVPALFVGAWVGGTMLAGGNPISGFGKGVEFVWNSLGDPWGARIVLTSLTMGGLVGIMRVGGGIDAVVRWITSKISNAKGAMLSTSAAGLIIFFEDYVNTVVVGTAMTPITDKYRISKEKLSYIVDSTAAPVACVAGISSWIAFMVGQVETQFTGLGIAYSGYGAYLQSIPFILYNLAAIVLVFFVASTSRDFGPMLKAERRARETGKLLRDDATPLLNTESDNLAPAADTPAKMMNFVVPLVVLVGLIFYLMLNTGGWPGVSIPTAIGAASSSHSLVWGSFGAIWITLFFYKIQGIATWTALFQGYIEGMRSIFMGTLILIFAWTIGSAIKGVGTAEFLVGLTEGILSPGWIPLIAFIIAAIVSFSTGTSYGTMGVVMPIVIPLVHATSGLAGIDPMTFMFPAIGSVFAGAVFGDHCSPISDTTVMSSMFTGSDHIDHVKTQVPYAMVAASGAIIGYIGVALGLPGIINLILAIGATVGLFWLLSKPIEESTSASMDVSSNT